eukprot:s1496_g5.t1
MALPSKEEMPKKKRVLKKEESEVTLGPDGYPMMLATQSDTETGSEAANSGDGGSESCLQRSPPPVLKADWKKAAGTEADGSADGSGIKKEAATQTSDEESSSEPAASSAKDVAPAEKKPPKGAKPKTAARPKQEEVHLEPVQENQENSWATVVKKKRPLPPGPLAAKGKGKGKQK